MAILKKNLEEEKFVFLIDAGFMISVVKRFSTLNPDYQAFHKMVGGCLAGFGEKISTEKLPVHIWSAAPIREDEGFQRFASRITEAGFKLHLSFGTESYIADIRRFFPDGVIPQGISGQLQRHDAFISYTIGLLASSHRIIVATDSYLVAETLYDAADRRKGINYFVGLRSMVGKYLHEVVSQKPNLVRFIDIEDQLSVVFPTSPSSLRSMSRFLREV